MTVMDPRTAAALQQAFRRESLSLLRYVGEAYPWTSANGGAALARLREIEAEDRSAAAALGRFLFRRHVPPSVSNTFPVSFTTANFLALEHLLPRLIDAQRQAIAELERDAAAVADADAKAELRKLLTVKRMHLSELEGLKAPHGEATKV
jgi:hypothetical protein